MNKIECPLHYYLHLNHDLHFNCYMHIDQHKKMCNKEVKKEVEEILGLGAATLYERCSIAPCHNQANKFFCFCILFNINGKERLKTTKKHFAKFPKRNVKTFQTCTLLWRIICP